MLFASGKRTVMPCGFITLRHGFDSLLNSLLHHLFFRIPHSEFRIIFSSALPAA
jgi:hypothetical protein